MNAILIYSPVAVHSTRLSNRLYNRWQLAVSRKRGIRILLLLYDEPYSARGEIHNSIGISVSVCLSVLSVTLVYCGQTVGWIEMKLGTRAGLGPGHIVLDGDLPPLPKKGWIKMTLGMEMGLGPSHIVPDGDPATLPKKRAELPQFSAHFSCDQTAGCIKMLLDMEVGLSPGDFVLDGNPAPLPKKGAEPPIFSPCLLWPNGWTEQDATWYGGRPRPMRHCVRWGPIPQKGGTALQFSAHGYCGQTAGRIEMPLRLVRG